jgi:ABC-type ATPase involved in cell division
MFRFYDFIRLAVVTPPLLVSSQMKLVGAENLPTGGGFILASTHTSWFDPLWLARAGGRDVTDSAPEARDVGMAFQNFALFPHMSAFDDVASALRARKAPRAAPAKSRP